MSPRYIILVMFFVTFQKVQSGTVKATDNEIDISQLLNLFQAGGLLEELDDGVTQDENEQPKGTIDQIPIDNNLSVIKSNNILAPQLEILRLIETFITLKGEMTSRVHALIADNFDLVRSIYQILVNKISKLHSFSLTGVHVIRKICEFALLLLSQWQVNVPTLTLDNLNTLFS